MADVRRILSNQFLMVIDPNAFAGNHLLTHLYASHVLQLYYTHNDKQRLELESSDASSTCAFCRDPLSQRSVCAPRRKASPCYHHNGSVLNELNALNFSPSLLLIPSQLSELYVFSHFMQVLSCLKHVARFVFHNNLSRYDVFPALSELPALTALFEILRVSRGHLNSPVQQKPWRQQHHICSR